MSDNHRHARAYLEQILAGQSMETLAARLAPKTSPPAARPHCSIHVRPEEAVERLDRLGLSKESRDALGDVGGIPVETYEGHIENFIGTVKAPVGLAGPLRVNGVFAQGDYSVPLATTEAALVASYHRGALLITESGGCTALLLSEGISRAPGFAFRDLPDAGRFVAWALTQMDAFRIQAESTTRHGKLEEMNVTVEGNHVYLNFEFTTGDASGQNMVTLAIEAICRQIEETSPVKPVYHFVEANLSGDKKASAQSFLTVRGKKGTAEATLPAELVQKRLHTTPERMVDYWRMSALGGVMSGTLGVQGHYANGLAAVYIACGQDAACVAESAVGVTRLEVTGAGALYAAVTLPNLVVGTVGGGTELPSQRACLEIMGLAGPGNARAFAEVCAGLAMAGELSIIGAMASGEFARAHRRLARGRDA